MISNNRAKEFFVTINKGAPCYEHALDITLQQQNCTYYLILHDKDNIKQEHFHIILLYTNARTFSSIQKKYEGAHIEICNYPNSSIRYLIHKDNPEKEQYDISKIKTNSDINQLLEIMEETVKEAFDPNMIIEYYHQGCKSFLLFYQRFGANIMKYQTLIKNVIYDLNELNIARFKDR